jgi:hypothetical protein
MTFHIVDSCIESRCKLTDKIKQIQINGTQSKDLLPGET